MDKLEQLLNNEKEKIEKVNVPYEMESKLRSSLEVDIHVKKIKIFSIRKIAILLIIVVLVGYNFNTLAYYGKKMTGYDNVMSGTLKDLNELGNGQLIGESYTFNNKVKVTLDGVMLDDNNFIAFYTLYAPDGNVDDVNNNISIIMKGFGGIVSMSNGTGQSNDENTKISWVSYFEPPAFYMNKIDFLISYSDNGVTETGEISFKLDRNKAMGHTLEKEINKSFKLNDCNIKINKITASPTTTQINGQIQSIIQLGLDTFTEERIRPEDLNINLAVNGKEMSAISWGISTNLAGITFHFDYDALPEELNSIDIKLNTFSAYHDVDEKIKFDKGEKITILNHDITINSVDQSKEETYITLTTEESTLLRKVFLNADGNRIPLDHTDSEDFIKTHDGIMKRRTLHFKGIGESLELEIKGLTYKESYNQIIKVPID